MRAAFPERRILYFDALDSTMRAAADSEPGTIVLADRQLAGMGRHGHTWHSEPGHGIYCSIVLPAVPVLTLALGVAAVEAIAQATGIQCDLRWPNDLMLDNRKVAGILVQLVNGNAIAGIGINVNHPSFPAELAKKPLRSGSIQAARSRAKPSLIALFPAIDAVIHEDSETILRLFYPRLELCRRAARVRAATRRRDHRHHRRPRPSRLPHRAAG